MIQGTAIDLVCPICSKEYQKGLGHYNRAVKLNAKMYCGKACSSIGRKIESDKHLKPVEQLKAEKAEYDKARRNGVLKQAILESRKKYYHDNKETIAPKLKVYRDKNMSRHVEYCRRPDQRTKERLRNRRKNGLTELKTCLCCKQVKQKIEFEAYTVFPDNRLYMCKVCEEKDLKELNITTRELLATMRSNLIKTKSILKIKDVVKYPYLIEANKYLLLLKRITR